MGLTWLMCFFSLILGCHFSRGRKLELEKSPLVILYPSYLPYAEDNHCSDIKNLFRGEVTCSRSQCNQLVKLQLKCRSHDTVQHVLNHHISLCCLLKSQLLTSDFPPLMCHLGFGVFPFQVDLWNFITETFLLKNKNSDSASCSGHTY